MIIAALIIAIVMLSTTSYVLNSEERIVQTQTSTTLNFDGIKMDIRNTVISALANISNGGSPDVLTSDLIELLTVLRLQTYESKFELSFSCSNALPYMNGTWMSWNNNGSGISSSYIDSSLNVSGSTESYSLDYATNITTAIAAFSTYAEENGQSDVNITYTVNDENGPALIETLNVYILNSANYSWQNVDPSSYLASVDFGNGTYSLSFATPLTNPANISLQAIDSRGITVMTNMTSSHV